MEEGEEKMRNVGEIVVRQDSHAKKDVTIVVSWEYDVLRSDPRIAQLIPEANADLTKHLAANKIQRAAKAKQKRLRKENNPRDKRVTCPQRSRESQLSATKTLQRLYRGHAARRYVRGKRVLDRHKEKKRKEAEAAVSIQSQWRRCQGRARARKKRMDKHAHAVKLQAAFRGYEGRRKAKRTAAAIMIQKHARKMRARDAVQARREKEARAEKALKSLSESLPSSSLEFRVLKEKKAGSRKKKRFEAKTDSFVARSYTEASRCASRSDAADVVFGRHEQRTYPRLF